MLAQNYLLHDSVNEVRAAHNDRSDVVILRGGRGMSQPIEFNDATAAVVLQDEQPSNKFAEVMYGIAAVTVAVFLLATAL